MRKLAYLGMDVHVRHCVLGQMDVNGVFAGNTTFETSERNIANALEAVKAKDKYLAIEEGPLTYWVAQVAKEHVTRTRNRRM